MRPRDMAEYARLDNALTLYEAQFGTMPGLVSPVSRTVFLEQILESLHRVNYARRLATNQWHSCFADPADLRFDPLKAAVLRKNANEFLDACWLVFLATHFGKHRAGEWLLPRLVYGRLGQSPNWDWNAVSTDPVGFQAWISSSPAAIRAAGSTSGFGNHRRYESLENSGLVATTYVTWVHQMGPLLSPHSFSLQLGVPEQRDLFDQLYRAMRIHVLRFGRLATFDFLAMLGKLELVQIEPGLAYLSDASGPRKGALAVFGSGLRPTGLEERLARLDLHLSVGMQVLEDALCNWQKSPNTFVRFRG